MKRIVFTVTNELVYDQRMIRICKSLSQAGYDVTLVGRSFWKAAALTNQPFKQKRLFCLFTSGKLFYIEYNFKLFFFLLFSKTDAITAIDLDTIVPCLYASKWKHCQRFYDAHELFTQMKEVVSRPAIHHFWSWIERKTVPQFEHAYTVNEQLAEIFKKKYGINFEVIRNITFYEPTDILPKREPFILYQGAVNEGRCFESLIPAMKNLPYPLIICGDGNFMNQLKELVKIHGVEDKVIIKGKIEPNALRKLTASAMIGITLFEHDSTNNYLSLANRFFDYMHAGTPQICVDFPAYRQINDQYAVAILVADTEPETVSRVISELMTDKHQWENIHQHALFAAKALCWQEEEKKLVAFYQQHLG